MLYPNDYPSSLNRKKHQRYVNKQVRILNKLIEQDELWRGRFVVRQYQGEFFRFSDRSGGYLWLVFEFIDKKTGNTKRFREQSGLFLLGELTQIMNDFITDYCEVWKKEDPYHDEKIDYTKVRLEDVQKNYVGIY